MEDEEQLSAFVEKWSLDTRAESSLKQLDAAERAKAMSGFTPHDGSRNTSAKFTRWLGGFRGAGNNTPVTPVGGGSAVGLARSPDAAPAIARTAADIEQMAGPEAVANFVERWSIDDAARLLLTELPTSVRIQVLQGFAPGASTRSNSGRLQAYIHTMNSHPEKAQPGRSSSSRADPNPRGSVGGSVGSSHVRTPPTASVCVVARGPVGSGAADGKGRQPAGSVSSNTKTPSGMSGGGKGQGKKGKMQPLGTSGNMERHVGSGQKAAAASGGRLSSNGSSQVNLTESLRKWNLNAEAQHAFSLLPHSSQTEVAAAFNPPADTVNVSGRFLAFVRRQVPHRDLANTRRIAAVGAAPVSRQHGAVNGSIGGSVRAKYVKKSETRPPPGLAETA